MMLRHTQCTHNVILTFNRPEIVLHFGIFSGSNGTEPPTSSTSSIER